MIGNLQNLRCTICGKPSCACWEKCSCGWSTQRGHWCNNPNTVRCSIKLQRGVYNRSTKKYEPKPGVPK